jgi:hypothetical protein
MDNRNQILVSVTLPRSSGYSSKLINAGLINSQGWEFTLGGTVIQNSSGLTWDVDLNYQKQNTLKELAEGLDRIQIME